jgi:hypothetical protein
MYIRSIYRSAELAYVIWLAFILAIIGRLGPSVVLVMISLEDVTPA